jgi:hypothetical protein
MEMFYWVWEKKNYKAHHPKWFSQQYSTDDAITSLTSRSNGIRFLVCMVRRLKLNECCISIIAVSRVILMDVIGWLKGAAIFYKVYNSCEKHLKSE